MHCARDAYGKKEWAEASPLHDPTDPTCQREIAKNRDEVDAMLEAHAIDARLPRILYLRKQRKPLREIGRLMEPTISHVTVNKILSKLTPKLLRACGLSTKRTR